MTAAARFRQADLSRALRAAEKAGWRAGRVEIKTNGEIVITAASGATLGGGSNPWDEVIEP